MLSFDLWLILSCFAGSSRTNRHVAVSIFDSSAIEVNGSFRERYIAHRLEDLEGIPVNAQGAISYRDIPIPSASEMAIVMSHLKQHSCEVSVQKEVLDFSMRFAALSYSRNSGEAAQYTILAGPDGPEVIEVQLHGSEDQLNGAHAVVYLYKAEGGVGVVLSFKGSTLNIANWTHNLNAFTSEKFLAAEARDTSKGPESEATVHEGFLKYKSTLDARMELFSLKMTPIFDVLTKWKINLNKATSLYRWLTQGNWEWCLVVGHSLGGGMAQLAAAEISLSEKQPFLATIGSPTAGNSKFAEILETVLDLGESACPLTRVLPRGGLRFYNWGDPVTFVGYWGVWGAHAGHAVALGGRPFNVLSPYHNHLHYTFQSSLLGDMRILTLQFPGVTYNPIGFDDMPLEHGRLNVTSAGSVALESRERQEKKPKRKQSTKA